MNYLARICLGALSSLLPTFFFLQFSFDLQLFFSELCSSSTTKCLFFSTEPVTIAPGTFCSVAGSAGKSFEKPILSLEATAKKSVYLLILSVLFPNIILQLQKDFAPHLSSKQTCTSSTLTGLTQAVLFEHVRLFTLQFIKLTTGSLARPKSQLYKTDAIFHKNNVILRLTTIYF